MWCVENKEILHCYGNINWSILYGKQYVISQNIKNISTMNSYVSFQRTTIPQIWSDCHTCAHYSSIDNLKKMETIQVPNNRWRYDEVVTYRCNEILHSHSNDKNILSLYNMDGTEVIWNKSKRKKITIWSQGDRKYHMISFIGSI